MKKIVLATCMLALLGTIPAGAQVDFSVYVALGDSLTAGFASGSLHQYYQERSYPALLARQAGVATFELPLVSAPGIPQIYVLQSLSPMAVGPIDPAPGDPINATLPGPYQNLAVPGATLYDMLFTTGNILDLLGGVSTNPMHDLILRDGEHTALEQCIGQAPTFITVWIGNNDVLSAALAADPIEGFNVTPVDQFAQEYANALGALATMAPQADIVVMTIPDVTALPFVTTVPPYVDIPGVGVVPIVGSEGPLPADAYVTLSASAKLAQGFGLPGGPPLPEDINFETFEQGYVLRADEVAFIQDRIAAFNDIIRGTASQVGAEVLDVHEIFNGIVGGDRWVLGGIELSEDFLTGGIFSYDGIHPQHIGYALVAVNLIDLINERMGGNIPQINMQDVLFEGGAKSAKPWDNEFIFTQEASEQLMRIFPPRKAKQPRMSRGVSRVHR